MEFFEQHKIVLDGGINDGLVSNIERHQANISSCHPAKIVRRRHLDDLEPRQFPSENAENTGTRESERLDNHQDRYLQRSVEPFCGMS